MLYHPDALLTIEGQRRYFNNHIRCESRRVRNGGALLKSSRYNPVQGFVSFINQLPQPCCFLRISDLLCVFLTLYMSLALPSFTTSSCILTANSCQYSQISVQLPFYSISLLFRL